MADPNDPDSPANDGLFGVPPMALFQSEWPGGGGIGDGFEARVPNNRPDMSEEEIAAMAAENKAAIEAASASPAAPAPEPMPKRRARAAAPKA